MVEIRLGVERVIMNRMMISIFIPLFIIVVGLIYMGEYKLLLFGTIGSTFIFSLALFVIGIAWVCNKIFDKNF